MTENTTPENIRPWGKYTTVSKTKIIKINPNKRLSLQYHHNREEFWQIIKGSGEITIDNKTQKAKVGDCFNIPKLIKHRAKANQEGLEILEIATGDVEETDIIRIKDDFNRN